MKHSYILDKTAAQTTFEDKQILEKSAYFTQKLKRIVNIFINLPLNPLS